MVWSNQKFKLYIRGQKVKVVVDHHALCWLITKSDLAGRLARWSLAIQDIEIEICHRSGRLHEDADALSRQPVGESEQDPDLPLFPILRNASTNLDPITITSTDITKEQNSCPRLKRLISILFNENASAAETNE